MSSEETTNPDPRPPQGPASPSVSQERVISSEELLLGDQEIIIDHQGERYRLRLTRNGKLILQK